jgi:hypothetical protein
MTSASRSEHLFFNPINLVVRAICAMLQNALCIEHRGRVLLPLGLASPGSFVCLRVCLCVYVCVCVCVIWVQ